MVLKIIKEVMGRPRTTNIPVGGNPKPDIKSKSSQTNG